MSQQTLELSTSPCAPPTGGQAGWTGWIRQALPYTPAALLVLAGVAFRLTSLTGPFGAVDSDQAIAGLMARHVWHGNFSAFFWGHPYGGSADAFVLAPFVALAPGSPFALRSSALLESIAIALVLWRVLLRMLPPRQAAFAAAAAFAYPAYSAVFSAKAELFYDPIVLLGLLLFVFTLRYAERPDDWRNPIAWGLVAGVGWWLGPTISIYALASLLWLLWRARAALRLRALGLCAPPFLIGAAPWIYVNLTRTGFPSLNSPRRVGTLWQHTTTFVRNGVPGILGLRRIPDGTPWVVVAEVGAALTAVLAAVVLYRCWVTARSSPLPLAIFTGAVIVIATIPWSGVVVNGRYYFYIAPLVIAVLVSGLRGVWRQSLAAVGMVVLGTAALNEGGAFQRGVVPTLTSLGTRTNTSDQRLIRDLERWGLTRVYANYWVAYRDDYLSDEQVVMSPFYNDHQPEYTRLIESAPRSSYLFPAGTLPDAVLESRLTALQVPFVVRADEGFWIITPDRNLSPRQLNLPLGFFYYTGPLEKSQGLFLHGCRFRGCAGYPGASAHPRRRHQPHPAVTSPV